MIARMLRRALSNLLSWVIFATALVAMLIAGIAAALVALRALVDMEAGDGPDETDGVRECGLQLGS